MNRATLALCLLAAAFLFVDKAESSYCLPVTYNVDGVPVQRLFCNLSKLRALNALKQQKNAKDLVLVDDILDIENLLAAAFLFVDKAESTECAPVRYTVDGVPVQRLVCNFKGKIRALNELKLAKNAEELTVILEEEILDIGESDHVRLFAQRQMQQSMKSLFLISSFAILVLRIGGEKASNGKVYVDRTRGIPLERKPLYDPNKDFVCLDGSATVPFDWVNDDYCDCKDGSDEPGTSACPTGRFQCINLGHRPVDIPSSRVNDQICDCCDGSDEYAGFTNCPDVCDEIGRQAREEADQRAQINREGYQKRLEMAKEGQKMKKDKEKELEELRLQKDTLDPQRDELDMKKQDAEKQANDAKDVHRRNWDTQKDQIKREKAQAAFTDLDTNLDNSVSVAEIRERIEFDRDSDGSVSDDEAREHLAGRDDSDFDHFISDVWDGLRQIYRPPGYVDASTQSPPTADDVPPPTDTQPSDIDDDENDDEEEDEDVDDDEVEDFDSEKYMKDGEKNTDDNYTDPDEVMPPYDEATQKLIDEADEVRKQYDEVDRQFSDIQTKIKDIEDFLNMDLGPDEEWAPLQDTCIEYSDSQYTYKLCLFGRAAQRDKGGSHETSLGNWEKFSGESEDKYTQLRYSNGQSCWNGPERSTDVLVRCGLEAKLLTATEPGRCEYRFEMEAPVVCVDPTASGDPHEEL